MTVSTPSARHLLLRLGPPARLPDALLGALRDEVVLAGWMRASGMLSDVQLRVVDPRSAAPSAPRRIAGRVQVISLEGSVGLAGGDISCGLRVVLARETDSGLETLAGDLVEAQIEALEVLVTAFDEITATRLLDRTGVWVLEAIPPAKPSSARDVTVAANVAAAASPASEPALYAPPPAPPAAPPASAAPVTAPPARIAPSSAPRPSPTFSATNNALPQKIARPVATTDGEDSPVPEPGDTVEHFAFGRCEVVKTDGDRLHVRLGKDQRVKEIALEMLRVTPLPSDEGQSSRHWKLARKL